MTLKRETLYGRKISSDMELTVMLAPGRYWERCLEARLADLVDQRFVGNANVRPDDTDVVVDNSRRGVNASRKAKRYVLKLIRPS